MEQGGCSHMLMPPAHRSLCFQLPRAPHRAAPAAAAVRGVHPPVPSRQPWLCRLHRGVPRRPQLSPAGHRGLAACRAWGPPAPCLPQPPLHVLGARARHGRAAAQRLQHAPRCCWSPKSRGWLDRASGSPPDPPGELLRGPGAVPGITGGLGPHGAPGWPRNGGDATGAAEGHCAGHPQCHR